MEKILLICTPKAWNHAHGQVSRIQETNWWTDYGDSITTRFQINSTAGESISNVQFTSLHSSVHPCSFHALLSCYVLTNLFTRYFQTPSRLFLA